jgi:hypothetical protein
LLQSLLGLLRSAIALLLVLLLVLLESARQRRASTNDRGSTRANQVGVPWLEADETTEADQNKSVTADRLLSEERHLGEGCDH